MRKKKKKKCSYSKDICTNIYDFSAAFHDEMLASATAITVVFFLWQALINLELDNRLIIPDQCKATLDVAGNCNNVGWIPFAQNADTIEKAIAANKLLSCMLTLLQKFAFLHLQIKLFKFSTDAPKKMLLFKGHLSQHPYDFSAAAF